MVGGTDDVGADDAGSPGTPAPARLSGNYRTDMVFKSGQVYFIQADVYIAEGTTVTMEAGAILKFNASHTSYSNYGSTIKADFIVDGDIIVQGTEDNPVIFTSSLDNSVGGSTSTTLPSSGNWGQVFLRNGARGSFDYAEFIYALGGIRIQEADLTATNITVRDSRAAVVASPNDSPDVRNLSTRRVAFGGVSITGGQSTKDVTWGIGDAPVVVRGDVRVLERVTLTIEPGTVVKFADTTNYSGYGYSIKTDLLIDGQLHVNGTKEQPVVFTCIYDDLFAGDTNGDGSSSSPAKGQWGTIFVGVDASAQVTFSEFRYAVTGITISSGDLVASDIKVKDSRSAIYVSPIDSPIVDNLETRRVDHGGVTIAAGNVSRDTTWGRGNAPLIIDGDITVQDGATLTIQPGSIIKFDQTYVSYSSGPYAKADLIVQGGFIAEGTSSEPIIFTSSRDDSYAGDTNGDGSSTTPANGDWGTISIDTAETISTSNVSIYYARRATAFP